MTGQATDRYAQHYDEGELWSKLRRYALRTGRELVEKALLLYLVLRDPQTPAWAKTTVVGALGYFIAPIDAIPDLIPGIGFTDDLGVLAAAVLAVATSITPRMREQARQTVGRWFGVSDAEVVVTGAVIETDAEVVAREQSA